MRRRASADQPIILSQGTVAGGNPESASSVKSVDAGTIEIKSPMVGTFYRASSPGAKPFVDVGEEIHPGDVVCIIEAMKLMNEIKAEIGGHVVEILVENGEPVEFGQPLFLVKSV